MKKLVEENEKMKKLLKIEGITLIALTISFIIMIIITGVIVGTLNKAGVIEKSKLSSEKYKNSSDAEEGTINQYAESVGNYDTKVATTRNANQAGNPTGTIIVYSVDKAPDGYLKCEGQAVSRNNYKKLFNVIGTTYGEGDGSTTFNVPDLRGEFLRGTGTNSHTNQGSGTTVGIHQDATANYLIRKGASDELWLDTDATKNITLSLAINMDSRYKNIAKGTNRRPYWSLNPPIDYSYSSDGGSLYTTRPTNTSVLYCIKY